MHGSGSSKMLKVSRANPVSITTAKSGNRRHELSSGVFVPQNLVRNHGKSLGRINIEIPWRVCLKKMNEHVFMAIPLDLWMLKWRFLESWGYPQNIIILNGIFHETNYPAIGIFPCDYGNPQIWEATKTANTPQIWMQMRNEFDWVTPRDERCLWKIHSWGCSSSPYKWLYNHSNMEVSWNRGTPSHHPFFVGFSLINQPAIGVPPWLWKPPDWGYVSTCVGFQALGEVD